MNNLFEMREYLTVEEAARHLSGIFAEEVSEADILRLALDGKLTLSVNLVNAAQVRRGNLARLTFTALQEDVVTIRGIWDLPMIGNERVDVENKYQMMCNGPTVTDLCMDGTFVKRPGILCQLQRPADRDQFEAPDGSVTRMPFLYPVGLANDGVFNVKIANRTVDGKPSWYSMSTLPDDSVLVVRTAALAELTARLSNDPTQVPTDALEKSIETRERTTLLTIIAALAKKAGIEVTKHAVAGAAIELLTDAMGARVATRTVQDHLKRIPDALERRRKTAS